MSGAKYSRGPFRASTVHRVTENGGWISFVIKGADGKSVANCTSNSVRDPLEIRANAALFEAAPDLATAATRALAFLHANYATADMPDIIVPLEAALAKAGVTP